MPRLPRQLRRKLIEEIAANLSMADLSATVANCGYDLERIAAGAVSRKIDHNAADVVDESGKGEWLSTLLGELRTYQYPALRTVVDEVSASLADEDCLAADGQGQAIDVDAEWRRTVIPSDRRFIDRKDLRRHLRELVSFADSDARVLCIQGDSESGKTHTWHFLHHIAACTGAFQLVNLDLKTGDPADLGPGTIMGAIASLLDLSVPPFDRYAQPGSLAASLRYWLVGQLQRRSASDSSRLVLFLDSIDQAVLPQGARDMIEHLIDIAQLDLVDGLRIVAIGYPHDALVRHRSGILYERTQIFPRDDVRDYLAERALAHGLRITDDALDFAVAEAYRDFDTDLGTVSELAFRIRRIENRIVGRVAS